MAGVDIPVVGIIKGLSDSALLDIVQRQTFRYFWHFGHPVSGLARERSNTIRGEYFWDYADEAYGSVNLSTNIYDTETCAIGGTGFDRRRDPISRPELEQWVLVQENRNYVIFQWGSTDTLSTTPVG